VHQSGRFFSLVFGALLLLPDGAHAQRRPLLEVALPIRGAAVVTASNLFSDPDIRELVRSGFPLSLHFRLELWRVGGLFNDIEGRHEWDFIVQYDPSAQRYRVVRREGGRIEDAGSFATLSTAQLLIERPTRVPLLPAYEGRRYYYDIALDIEALSVSDMDQLERWLRGVRGSTAASALGSGVRTLMLRMLGGETRKFKQSSPKFTAAR